MNLSELTVTDGSDRSAPSACGAGPSAEFAQTTKPKTTKATVKKPSSRGFENFIDSPEVILPLPKSRRTWSRLVFLSVCFAGWDGRNTISRSHFPFDKEHHAQTSRLNFGRNMSAGLSQKQPYPGRRSLWASGFPD